MPKNLIGELNDIDGRATTVQPYATNFYLQVVVLLLALFFIFHFSLVQGDLLILVYKTM